ncbi:MAG: ABC transporter permease [Synergistaceae bacterium]|nr:ABC transporter permease [Synergistaceae bacterium]
MKIPKLEHGRGFRPISVFTRHKFAVAGLIVILSEIILVVLLPVIFKMDPIVSDLSSFGAKPGAGHLLGTDSIGRDLFARLVYGGRTSLFVGFMSTLFAVALGVPLGLLAGYYRRWVECAVMRLVEVFMSFPSMVLILVLVSVIGPSVWTVTVVIGFLGWTQFARLVFASVLTIREKEYVLSASAIGSSDAAIILKYIFPGAVNPVLIAGTFMTASSILLESSLSFLGMGVQPPASSWGSMLYDAQSIAVLSGKPWQWIPPGFMLILTVLCINFLGDGIRNMLEPKNKTNI